MVNDNFKLYHKILFMEVANRFQSYLIPCCVTGSPGRLTVKPHPRQLHRARLT